MHGVLHEPRATDSTSKSALYVCFRFVCQMKTHIIFVLIFSYFILSFFSFFPHPYYPTRGFFILR